MSNPDLCNVVGISPSNKSKIEISFDGQAMSIMATDMIITGDGTCSQRYALLIGLSNVLKIEAEKLLTCEVETNE